MWTNGKDVRGGDERADDGVPGWLMISMVTLTLFNMVVLLSPPQSLVVILELMPLPFSARRTLLVVTLVNMALSVVFEQWGSRGVAYVIGRMMQLRRGRRRTKGGETYKAVERGIP
jgi:cation-transporting ATPase 13A2